MSFNIKVFRTFMISLLVTLTVISLTIGCILLSSDSNMTRFTNKNIIQLNYDYTVLRNNAIYGHMLNGTFSDSRKESEETTYTVRLNYLNSFKYKDPALGLTTAHCGILVYNGTELLYTFLGSGHQIFDYYGETRNSIIPLGNYDASTPIEIQFIVPPGYSIEISDMVFGDKIALDRYFNRDGLLKIYLTGSLLLVSLVWFVASLFFKRSDGKMALLSFAILSFAICLLILANLRTPYFKINNSMWRLDISLFVLCLLPCLIIFFLRFNHDFKKEPLLNAVSNLSLLPVVFFILYQIFSSFLGYNQIAMALQILNLILTVGLLIAITSFVIFNISSNRSYSRPLVFALLLLNIAIILSTYDLFFDTTTSKFVTPVITLFSVSMGILTFQALKMAVEAISSSSMKKNLMLKVYTDPMTKLLNRIAFEEKLTTPRREGATYLIMSLDLNGLKLTNDRFGHDVGDRLIKDFAEALQKATFAHSAHAFRVGGDEFAILIESDGKENPEEIIAAIRENFHPSEMSFNSFACGYTYCRPSDDMEDMYKEADERMYYNKQNYKRGERL